MKLFAVPLLLLLACFASAQQPYSFNRVNLAQTVPTKSLPHVNAAQLLAEDAANADKSVPYRFGFKHDVNLGITNSGLVEVLKDGSKLWRIGLKCANAYSVNLIFDKFHLPDGAFLYLYSTDKSYVVGPYTSKNNTWDKIFGSDLVKGGEIIVEYYQPAYAAFNGEVNISTVTHGYRDPFQFAKAFGDAGNCHNNSICPVAVDWQDDKRAVAILLTGGNAFCTGAMVGNVAQDGTPYFLTADHCLMPPYSAWVFRFNYESASCTPSVNGPTSNVVNGAVLKANNGDSDFGLLLLNTQPDPAYMVYYAGWNSQNTPASSTVAIHHPSGDVKKITFDDGAAISSGYFSTSGNNHWYVDWDNGVTEGGSSGSPLFDQNHRIVGQLHGGPSYCGSADVHDYYGKFSTSWTGGGTNATRLSNWLDAGNTGTAFINGYYPSLPTDTLNVTLLNIQNAAGQYCLGDTLHPVVSIRNDGLNTITTVVIAYTLDNINFTTDTFNVNIPMLGLGTVDLAPFVAPLGAGTIQITISDPNGGVDQNTSGNASSQNFNVVDGDLISFEIRTDDYPEETSYMVTNLTGDTLLISEPFTTANTVYTKSICMEAGCYNFKIFDSYGDGICCTSGNGYYKVKDETGTVLAQGDQFSFSQTKQFCTNATSIPTNPFDQITVNVYPNPVNNAMNIEWSVVLGNVDLSLSDALGREVLSRRFTNASFASLDLNFLANGIYNVRIKAGNEIVMRKITVLHL